MTNKWKNLLLALVLLVGLSLPIGIVGADNEEVQTEMDDDPIRGTLVSEDDSITVTKLDQEQVENAFGDISLEKDLGLVRSRPDVIGSHFDASRFEVKDPWGIPGLKKYDAHAPTIDEGPMTRATDDESGTGDMINGSSFSRWGEDVAGSLTHSNVQSLIDGIDWYQLELHDDTNPAPSGLVSNVSFELTDFSSTDTLYEFAVEDDGTGQMTLSEDYADFMTIYVANYDTMTGINYMGGKEFNYDDGDDNDGWVWDGDNTLYPDDNWTFNFIPPVKAEGINDADGFANGFVEDGFVWVGLTFSWWLTQTSPQTRDGFEIDYEFTLDRVTQTGDQGSNDYKNASAAPNGNIRIDSCYNQIDWYQFTGTDHSKLWNMSFKTNWTWLNAGMDNQYIRDNWVYIYILWYIPGEDNTWGTPDDDLRGVVYHYTYYGIGSNGIFDANGNLPIDFSAWLHNNWTDAPQTPEDMRKAYVGFLSEPQQFTWTQSGGQIQITGQFIPDWRAWSDYNVQLTVGEFAPNNKPTITEVVVQSDFEQDTTGGYYDSEFLLEVTYQDDDDDPPAEIWVYIDKDTPYEKASDISSTPTDVFDLDYTDGKTFKLEMLGDDLTDDPFPHTVHVEAIDDVPEASIRSAMWSELFEFGDGIRVWDDEPVDVNPNRQPFDELMEDDPTTYFPLEGIDGQFKDPENDFVVFYIMNETYGNWSDNYDSDLMNIDVLEYEGIWQIAVTPKTNQYGSESIRLQGEDEHSWTNMSTSITVREVNDPPKVFYIEIDGDEFEVDNVDPLRPVIHLEDQFTFKEDTEYTFTIYAEDTDLEEDRSQLEYSYVRSTSSDWDEDPDVGYSSGEVVFTPNNNDVRAGNDKMVFSIDDREDDIKLEVYLEITNVNDPPTIMIPTTTARTWKQFSKLQIRPIASDEDKNDQITFSVNFQEAIGDDYDSLEDQLPFMDVTKGIDWDITPTTGDFFFELDDQNIWKTSAGMVKSQEITIVFKATDKEGGEAVAFINLVLNDENEEPPRPDNINVNPLKPNAKEPVNFWVDPVEDPDGDRLTYKWDFGDGSTGEGINVNHTYATKGYKTVQMWVEDGQFSTEKISLRVEVAEEPATDDDDDITPDDDDDTQQPQSESDNTLIIIVAVIIIVVVVLVVVLFIFLLIRKKPAPTAQMYPGYDQQALGAYGQQGLPPGAVGELPPQSTPELPPAEEGQIPPDNLPPADGQVPMEPQPDFAPAAPDAVAPVAAAPEMAQPEPAPEQPPAGNGCPSCGAAVDPTWFLCPNCKSPLQ